MCKQNYNGRPVLPLLMSPALSELSPLPEMYMNNHLFNIAYGGGFKMFSQVGGYQANAYQSVTPESLGLLNGQYFGQPLTEGSK